MYLVELFEFRTWQCTLYAKRIKNIARVHELLGFYSWCLVWFGFLGFKGITRTRQAIITVLGKPAVYNPKHLLRKDTAVENKSPCFVEHHSHWHMWVWEEVPWSSRISLIRKVPRLISDRITEEFGTGETRREQDGCRDGVAYEKLKTRAARLTKTQIYAVFLLYRTWCHFLVTLTSSFIVDIFHRAAGRSKWDHTHRSLIYNKHSINLSCQ